jgi:hypothetical protein
MVSALRVLSILTLAFFLGVGSALAVGYERVKTADSYIAKVHTKAPLSPDLWAATKEASFAEKIPAALDQAAALVKDILSQIGLGDKKTP